MKIYDRKNTQHRVQGKAPGAMTISLTRTGFLQISKAAVSYLGISAGDGLVVLEDEQFGDFYIGRGDANRSAFVLTKVGSTARLAFACSDIAEMLGKAAIAAPDWRWMVCTLFPAPEGRLGIDLRHARFPHRGHGDTTAAVAALKAKKRGRPAKEEQR